MLLHFPAFARRLDFSPASVASRLLAGAMLFLLSATAALRAADSQPPVTLTT